MQQPHISLTMIVKNEEQNLPRCLKSVADLVDEIIIVDTGSTDNTKKIAQQFGAKVFDFPWTDSFADARNETLKHATGKWIFWLDADDYFDESNREKLRQLFAALDEKQRAIYLTQSSFLEQAPNESVLFDRVHIFPNLPTNKWQFRVHEQITQSFGDIEYVHSGVTFQHGGYHSDEEHRRKADRNRQLCELELKENPDDPFVNFNLAWSLHGIGEYSKAIPYWEKAYQLSKPEESFRRKLLFLWARDHQLLNNLDKALEICLLGRSLYPDDVEILFLEALYRMDRGELELAEQELLEVVRLGQLPRITASYNKTLPAKAYCNLAEIYKLQNRDQEAENAYQKALNINNMYIPAWVSLGELYIKHQKWQAWEQIVMNLLPLPGGQEAAEVLRKGRDFMTTQVGLGSNQLIQQAEFLFQQGRLDEAEQLYQQMLNANFLPGVMYLRLGMIANMRGNYEQAFNHHQEAFRVDPTIAAKILPQGSPLQQWVAPIGYDYVETKHCPVCGSKKREVMNVVNCLPMNSFHPNIDPVRIWMKCNDCTHGYPKERPSDEVLKQIYSEPPPQHLQVWNYQQLTIYSDIIHHLHKLKPTGDFLDVGTAAGGMAGIAKDYGYNAFGMDIHEIYRDNVRRFGVEFILGDFNSYDFGARKFDIITFGDVIEHMVDPKKTMKVLDSILNKGGIAWVSTPNYDCAWTRAVGVNDPMWQESEHLQYFSKESMTKLFAENGFKIKDYYTSKRYQGSVEVLIERK